MLRPWELQITINVSDDKAIYLQIADAIINAVKAGKLRSGDALPGSRQLAQKLKVNRNTVIDALDVLLAEGWLVSLPRKGTFVAPSLPEFNHLKEARHKPQAKAIVSKPQVLFDDGLPDTRIAPINELAAAYRQIFNRKGRWQLMGYSDGAGEKEFREAIVQMLNYNRGMHLTADELFITRGSQMAMFLTAHCLINQGDYIAIENPGYEPAWQAFEHAGAKLLPISVDAEGIVTDELKSVLQLGRLIRAVYITPHHQFPTTVTLSLTRRLELVALSNHYGFTIIEDDYDNEFHFGQRPILPVSSIEHLENYVYIGTMSKIVAPALRIGFLAASPALIAKIGQLRKIIDVQGDNIMEQAMLQLINDGHIKRHLRKATLYYKAKRDYVEKLIVKHLSDKVAFSKPEGGLAFWLTPKSDIDLTEIVTALEQKGIQVLSPATFSFGKPVKGLRLGYASLNETDLEKGIIALAKILD
ncbi:PLP-dependent aminotransferase family protein [Pedobacter aquatilis]|uniref:MocR-like pyridoxine biosynthesis transcription factor PdxR n=1 Tax=Pedobacter aquatilis TaxID=351343 RepID=UPI00292E7820|nr:PLP-dependent aminotransferase family protein [Pedobacter aquatilis]